MAEYVISGNLNPAVDDTELLNSMQWFVSNYAGKMREAQVSGEMKILTYNIVEILFDDAVAVVTALKTQFGTKLGEWNVFYNDTTV